VADHKRGSSLQTDASVETDATVGSRVRHERKEQGITQLALAKRVGRTPQALSDLERHGRYLAAYELLARIAVALNLSADYLLGLTVGQKASIERERNTETLRCPETGSNPAKA